MRKKLPRGLLLFVFTLGSRSWAQEPWTWDKVSVRFETNNPTLRAGRLSVDEARVDEIAAKLRPNPQLSVVLDQFTRNLIASYLSAANQLNFTVGREVIP